MVVDAHGTQQDGTGAREENKMEHSKHFGVTLGRK